MAIQQLSRVIDAVRSASLPPEEANLTDRQLLERYVHSREEAAFAAIVQRHGPMVWGVCRRMLRSHQDAEDAFQATFLVLVRKAPGVVSVGNWLYGVAQQTALGARASAARRRTREMQVTAMPEPAAKNPDAGNDLRGVLDVELSRLPAKYREAIVLCDLEGRTRREAAEQLGLPDGTVATRLATARTMLARRLARQGAGLTSALLAAALAEHAASAGMPASVASNTIKAATLFAAGQATTAGISLHAVSLAEGVLKTMLLTKLKIAAVTVGVLLATGGFLGTAFVGSSPADSARAGQETALVDPAPQAAGEAKPQSPAAAAPSKKEAEAVPSHVNGTLKAIDAQNRTLTVGNHSGIDTFSVAKDAEIQIDGKPGPFAALPVGAVINLRRFVDAQTAGHVDAEGRWLSGVVKAIDPNSGTITFGDQAQNGAAGKTFSVPRDLPVSIDARPGQLAAIPMGAFVNLQLLADQTTVRCLKAEGSQVNGTVKAVDAANRTLTINDTSYPIAPDAHVSLDHKPGKLDDLPAGANVCLNLQVDQKTVLRISATGSSDFGQVKAVDAANGAITVTGGPPNDRVYQVPADAPIVIDGQPGSLAAIPVGAGLHALNLRVDQKTVSSINVVGPGYHHVGVTAVDAARRTFTIDDKAPAQIAGKTLSVAADAQIEVDGKPGQLAAIPAGAFLNLGLSVDGLTARNIQAEGPNLGGCGGSCVSAVDAASNTITFDAKGPPDVAGKTFRVIPDVWLQMDARPGKLSELPAGSYVNITLTVDRQHVRSVWATGPPLPGIGVVQAVDAERRTITVDKTTYPVAANANVVIGGNGGLAAVPIGANVSLRLCVDQKTVGTIAVQAK
jgi:RNA polymerase sigma factor (sigma-70 family)